LQQLAGLLQVARVHFCPLGQCVQVACFAFAFFACAGTLAIKDAPANKIARTLKLIFFICFKILNVI
jgi:hypothetical protein